MKKKIAELKDRIMEHLKYMAPADYPKEMREGWPYHSGGNFWTGWCDPTVKAKMEWE